MVTLRILSSRKTVRVDMLCEVAGIVEGKQAKGPAPTFLPFRYGRTETRSRSMLDGSMHIYCGLDEASAACEQAPSILFLGHISNQHQLREVLECAADATAESLLKKVLERYGIDGLRMVSGNFSAIEIDPKYIRLICGKTAGPPLYYMVTPCGRIVFTTELAALPESFKEMEPFNPDWEADLRGDPRRTCLKGVRRVVAGEVVTIRVGQAPLAYRYHHMRSCIDWLSEREAVRGVRLSIERCMDSFALESAACLVSGGLDSSIVAVLASQRTSHLRLYSVGTSAHNEFEQADYFAHSIGKTCTHMVYDTEQFFDFFPKVVGLVEHSLSTYIEYLVPVLMAHTKLPSTERTLLSGYGSDILFAGFARPEDSVLKITELVCTEYDSTQWSNETSQRMGNAVHQNILFPFFDSDVVECSFRCDSRLKHWNNTEKYVLRKAFEDVVDPQVVWRKKVGIHQGTGCESFFSDVVKTIWPTVGSDQIRQKKDYLAYFLLRQILIDKQDPNQLSLKDMAKSIASDSSHQA